MRHGIDKIVEINKSEISFVGQQVPTYRAEGKRKAAWLMDV